MSILIKGMEMPNNGVKWIVILKHIHGNLEIFDPTGKDESVFYEAVELPPHGRLIDGDELAKGCDAPYWCRWLSEIEDAPTIIPAEEVRDD